MIDTITLKIPFSCVHYKAESADHLFSVKINQLRYGVTSKVDTSYHTGIYVPNMVVRRYQQIDFKTKKDLGSIMFFYITFSVAKLFYGENLREVNDTHFEGIVKKLQEVMEKCGIFIEEEDIINADVREIHFSKNIILKNATTVNAIQIIKFRSY